MRSIKGADRKGASFFVFMEKFHIYILYSESSDKYYVGYSNNVSLRVERHNNPKFNSYTSKHIPWVLMAEIFVSDNRGDAMRIEKFIKKQKSRKFIIKIIENQNNDEFVHTLVRVPFERD